MQGNEQFVVTTTDGTQYYFGLNQLPGWTSGIPTTNSVWTEPVYATAADQPCYNATFAASSCPQAYRWNLDYVVDTHADVVSYFYTTETNAYAPDLGSTATASYVRAGFLSKVQYGQRAGQVYSTQPAGQVLFTSTGRCDLTTCDPATLSQSTASHWLDVPQDLACAANAACQVQSPSFWSEYMLSTIQTQALVGTTETNVDSWSLAHSYPATGDTDKPVVWLSSITHTGQDITAGGPSGTISLPPVVFGGTPLSNRVILTDGISPITRQRLTKITTETGEIIQVNYSAPGCAGSIPSNPSQNGSLCFPDFWTPPGGTAPTEDWFNKFIVASVTEVDPTGGSANDTIATTYTPVGAPAWHYNDNPLTPADQRTWDQWRGYSGMIVTTGTAPDPVTKTQYTYFRGMDGDTLPGGATRSATVTDSRSDPGVTDANQFTGDTYETVVYNGAAVVTDTITDPWSSTATASHALPGLPTQQSFLTGTADTKTYTPLANGTTRQTETDYTHDTIGRVTKTNDQGDVSVASNHLCTTTSYNDNTTAWILDAVAETSTVSVNCTTNPTLPTDAVSDVLTYYDNATSLTTAPTVGDVTMTQQVTGYTGSTPNPPATMSTTTVDQYGRPTASTNPDGKTTTTAYTPTTGAEPTTITVTDPARLVTTTKFDPLRDLPTTKTDPAAYVTTEQYDALGRLTAVYKPGQPAGPGEANLKYSYTVSNTGPSIVDTYTLLADDQTSSETTYGLVETLYDSMLRAREVQTQTPDNSRTITDTVYNTDGQQSQTNDPYWNQAPVSTTLVQAQVGQIPSATGYLYDKAGRKTAAIAYALGTQTWQTTYTYGGNWVTTVPPAGATPTTTFTDARSHTTDLYSYHSGVPTDPITDPASDYSDTHYTYTPAGKQAGVTDAAGNTWTYQYNLLGQQTSAQDPDTGTSTTTHDNAGLLLTATDARGKQTTTTYDNDARKTAQYDTTGNAAPSAGNKIAAWTYDTIKKGYPTASTSISGGDTITQTVTGYNELAKPNGQRTTLTGTDAALVPTSGYVSGYGYSSAGPLNHQSDPAVGNLPGEDIFTNYEFGQPVEVNSGGGATWTYASAVGYTEFGQPAQYTLPTPGGQVFVGMTYDPQTQALTDVRTSANTFATTVDDLTYHYTNDTVSAGTGLVTSTVDSHNGGATVDTQCFTYDYATRLSSAWTATDQCAATPTPGNSSSVGGPTPYWQSWAYDTAGDRATQVDHDTTGTTTNDTTTTYNYPTAGSTTDQPHTLTSTTATGPAAAANTATYTYDPAGNTTTITGGATGNQTLTWTDQNKLATDTTTNGTTTYVYDNTGNPLIRRDPGQTTLFLRDEQIVLNTTTGAITATRYYTISGTTIASRTGTAAPVYLIPDHQGTNQLAITSDTEAVTQRQYLPFGGVRGTPPPTWPGGDRGYVGGTPDPSTNLENLGAREYNPASGRFLSADPVLELTDPTQMGGYDYAGNNPTTGSDPTGLNTVGMGCPDGDCHPAPGINLSPKPGDTADHNAPNQKPNPVAHHPQNSGPGFGGKMGGESPPNSHLDPSVGPPAWQVGGMILLNILVLAGNPFGDDELDPALIEADREFLNSAQHDTSPSCGPNSFIGSTPVLMADGTSKPIDHVKVGDTITNAAPGAPWGTKDQAHTVTAVHVTYTDRDYTDITVNTGHGPATITGTAHHLYWDATTHVWTLADQLHVGDELQTSNGVHVTIAAVHDYTATMVTYNLTIDTLHTYYVEADTTPVLVHNDNCDGSPSGAVPSTSSLAHDVADATGGAVKANKGGYTVNVPYGSRGISVRVMDECGGRANYYRVSIPGKQAFTVTGEASTDPALTHIEIGESSLNDILGIIGGIQGGD